MTKKPFQPLFILSFIWCLGCVPSSQQGKDEVDSVRVLVDSSFLAGTTTFEPPEINWFDQRLEEAAPLLSSWGFYPTIDTTLKTTSEIHQHWWLNVFNRRDLRVDPRYLPSTADRKAIRSIRQVHFKKTWSYVIEEWHFDNEESARRWLDIAVNTTTLDDQKPPRIYWIDGNRMYFIMATTAHDWFAHSNDLIRKFTRKTRAQIEIFNKPLNLPHYKKLKREANSSTLKAQPYFYQPDTIGQYYRYFHFHQLRQQYPQRSIQDLEVKTYIHGSEIGTYENAMETLIGVKSKLADPNLGLLDLVGKTRSELIELLGIPEMIEKNLYVYEHMGDLIIISSQNDQVEWFHFIRTNLDINREPLPESLKYFSE